MKKNFFSKLLILIVISNLRVLLFASGIPPTLPKKPIFVFDSSDDAHHNPGDFVLKAPSHDAVKTAPANSKKPHEELEHAQKRKHAALAGLYTKEELRIALGQLKKQEKDIKQNIETLEDLAGGKEKTWAKPQEGPQFPYIGQLPEEVRDIIDRENNKEKYERFNVHMDRSFILHGAPGTGKTAMASKIAEELDGHFVHMNSAEIKNKYVGSSEELLRKLFKEAIEEGRKSGKTKTIIFLDEIDSILPKRDSLPSDSAPSHTSVVNQFLTLVEQLPEDALLVTATNNLDKVDTAAYRAGRMKRILVKIPTEEDRVALFKGYIEYFSSQVPESTEQANHNCTDEDIARWARETEDATPAEINKIVGTAAIYCAQHDLKIFDKKAIEYAFSKINPDRNRWSFVVKQKIKRFCDKIVYATYGKPDDSQQDKSAYRSSSLVSSYLGLL